MIRYISHIRPNLIKSLWKRFVIKIGVLLIIFAAPMFAQYWVDNSEGISVEAMGRGGASIAIADDAAGVWYNPAGLARITRFQAAMALDYISIQERYHQKEDWASDNLSASYSSKDDHAYGDTYDLGYFSIVKPLTIAGKRLTIVAGYRRQNYMPDIKGSWTQFWTSQFNGSVSQGEYWERWRRDTDGGIEDWDVACAMEVASGLSIGVNLHYMIADYGILTVSDGRPDGSPYNLSESYSYSGFLGDAGLQWRFLPAFTLGAVYRSGLNTRMDYRRTIDVDEGSYGTYHESVAGTTGVHWPDGYGFGLAWTASQKWLLALDYSRMNWSKGRMDRLNTFYTQGGEASDVAFPTLLGIDQWDTDTWRIGVEYRIPRIGIAQWILRAGYFRQEQMVNQQTAGRISEQPVYHGFSFGAGFAFGKMKWDIVVVNLYGNDKFVGEGGVDAYYKNYQKTLTTRALISGTYIFQ